MEGTAFSIDEANFDASLLPAGSRTPGTEEFHRAVTDYFQRSYAGMGGQLSVVFAAGRIEVAWEPAPPEAPAMATIGPLLQTLVDPMHGGIGNRHAWVDHRAPLLLDLPVRCE